MAVYKKTVIFCDSCGSQEEILVEFGDSLYTVMEVAESVFDWDCSGEEHTCPDCKEE